MGICPNCFYKNRRQAVSADNFKPYICGEIQGKRLLILFMFLMVSLRIFLTSDILAPGKSSTWCRAEITSSRRTGRIQAVILFMIVSSSQKSYFPALRIRQELQKVSEELTLPNQRQQLTQAVFALQNRHLLQAAGAEARIVVNAVIKTGRNRNNAPSITASSTFLPPLTQIVKISNEDHAVLYSDSK
jgi:hypothetical protein